MKNLYIILCLLSLSAFSQNSICNGTFNYIDNGGIANNYFANSDATTTICPNAGTVITVTFSSFNVELFNDGLYVYDGDSINPDKLISSGNPSGIGIMTTAGAYWGSNLPGPFTSSSPDGCLTFRFRSDGSTEGAGWIANISCSSPQSGFILNSFLDDNNNGTRDSNEFLFPYSYFTYQKNGGASIYASSWNGTSQVNAYNVADNYSFTNNLEPYLNNSYYSISNSSYANQTIGTTPGFVTLDFPVTSNVLYNDVSVYLHRLDRPKAGANYATRLTYTNYGNQIVNTGNISFTKDSYSSTVSTSVPVTSTTTGFDYNFVNLQPFETRFIDIVQSVP
ncbi:MAG: CUB domain-containing protein, partial [Flavobacterium sp.]|nr:CUB domain-containing protein [Flavobacterium sp.]